MRDILKSVALWVVLVGVAYVIAVFDGVGDPAGNYLALAYGAVASYATIVVSVLKDWWRMY